MHNYVLCHLPHVEGQIETSLVIVLIELHMLWNLKSPKRDNIVYCVGSLLGLPLCLHVMMSKGLTYGMFYTTFGQNVI